MSSQTGFRPLGPDGAPQANALRAVWVREVLIGIGATAALTLLFWNTDLDLRAQALAYSPVEPHWPYGRLLGWVLVYHLGTLPGLMLSVLAAVGFGLSFMRPEFMRWRYPCLFFVLLLALGPGLVINVLAKGFGGRPRPDQILEFGGLLEFRHPFQPGLPHKGFSFLCGHCSMGFMFMGLYFLLRGWRRWACLVGGFFFGLLQGVGRMVQGSHFASDALLGATVMFALAAALSPVAAWRPQMVAERRHRWRIAAATSVLIVLIVASFLFSFGMREEDIHVWLEPGQTRPAADETVLTWRARRGGAGPAKVLVAVEIGDLVLRFKQQPEPMLIHSLVTGFAFPGSSSETTVGNLRPGTGISYHEALKGLFVEKHGRFTVSLREDLGASLDVRTRDGQIILAGPLPARQLVVTGSFELSDPAGLLKRAGAGRFVSVGKGEPISLALEAQRVVVQP
jgi:membrane-associated PAP2 superfamily phosphatase